jgi:hypothetical protein
MNNEMTQEQKETAEIFETNGRDANTFYTESGNVAPIFQNHWIETTTGKNGIANLIIKILTDNGSVFKKDIDSPEDKKIAIDGGMFTSQILAKVKLMFTAGTSRYPESTVRTYLSVHMKHGKELGKIQLSKFEDTGRKGGKPRIIWYAFKSE